MPHTVTPEERQALKTLLLSPAGFNITLYGLGDKELYFRCIRGSKAGPVNDKIWYHIEGTPSTKPEDCLFEAHQLDEAIDTFLRLRAERQLGYDYHE